MLQPTPITPYLPSPTELTPAEVQSARFRLQQHFREVLPDLDTRPGSPFGDLHVGPLAVHLAAMERAVSRVFSDFDPENIAQGRSWNPEVAAAFLSNFGISPIVENTFDSGPVLIQFPADQQYEVYRDLSFTFPSGGAFRMKLAHDGPLHVFPVGTVLEDLTRNEIALRETAPGAYGIEIWLEAVGTSGLPVLEGDEATLDPMPGDIVGAVAGSTFSLGTNHTSLQILAAQVRDLAAAPSPHSRAGFARLVRLTFPASGVVTVSTSNDAEMLRAVRSPLGSTLPAADIWLRSSVRGTRTQVVRLPYWRQQDETLMTRFFGKVMPPEQVVRLVSVGAVANPSVALPLGGDVVKLLSRSSNAVRAPRASAAYSGLEEYWISIEMPFADGDEQLDTLSGGDGTEYAFFLLTWEVDPLVPTVQRFFDNPDTSILGIDVVAKAAMPLQITRFEIEHRSSGLEVLRRAQAQADVRQYLTDLGDEPASLASLSQIVAANGGGTLLQVHARCSLRPAPADAVLVVEDPLADIADSLATALPIRSVLIDGLNGWLNFRVLDPAIGTDQQTLATASRRTSRLVVGPQVVTFREVRS